MISLLNPLLEAPKCQKAEQEAKINIIYPKQVGCNDHILHVLFAENHDSQQNRHQGTQQER
jgi:hypothetical protein